MAQSIDKKISILGTVGVPANYGGFETLAENLVKYHHDESLPVLLTVYCSSKSYPARAPVFLSARLAYVPLNANGAQSIIYDMVSLGLAVLRRTEVILLLGVSGAIALPFVRLVSSAKVVTNIDGLEWRREKWRGWAKWFLRYSEKIAVRYSHEVVADNAAIVDYVRGTYGVESHLIAYGGDHAMSVEAAPVDEYHLPEAFAFSVCRIEPENNVHMIVEAFSRLESWALVLVGNWNNSEYGRALRKRYESSRNLYLLDSIYDLGKLRSLRSQASLYVHGHSAGGTNPSLVEAMHFGKAVLAFDCSYNRATTEDRAVFFKDADDLARLVLALRPDVANSIGEQMLEIAKRRYTWSVVARQYFDLL